MTAGRCWALSLLLLTACGREAAPGAGAWTAYARIVAVEDARGGRSLEPVMEATRDDAAAVRAWAVRALGRLGGADLLDSIAPSLADAAPEVRVAAAHAMASAVAGDEDVPPARRLAPMARALDGDPDGGGGGEEDPWVRAELAYALVRASRGPAELGAAARALDRVAAGAGLQGSDSLAIEARIAVARGYQRIGRSAPAGLEAGSVPALRLLAATRSSVDSLGAARVRRLALAALRTTSALTAGDVVAALGDSDPGVRREGVLALTPEGPAQDWVSRLEAAVGDTDATVRYEALRAYGRHARSVAGCLPILRAVDDANTHVADLALDLLADPCVARDVQIERLVQESQPLLAALVADAPRRGDELPDWHRPAHALAALAALEPDKLRPRLPDAARHPDPFFRAWVARASANAGDRTLLRRLATGDPDPNVRTEAVRGLGRVAGHAADSVYRAALSSSDGQLVMTAAGLLEGTADTTATAAAMAAALRRFTAMRRETTRDVRMALLDGLEKLAALPEGDLRALVTGYDPVLAARAARLLPDAAGVPVQAVPHPLDAMPTPDAAELQALSRSSVVLEMKDGGEVEIRLRPDWAATNAARFARLVRDGYYNGLTFHRVEPAFVIQGGSPGANEYAGADRYTRDELGLPAHWEGTVGVSTRGRDTGDGQIFINLVDNVRLDHQYTVFGEVVRGMDVVHGILEGAMIWSATVVQRRGG